MPIFKDLRQIINELIALRKEGQYWDFKQKHHQDKGELLHDILCLANAKHDGPRYLIFGVNNEHMVVGVGDGTGRRTQADIVGFLRDNQSKFAFDLYPDIRLEMIILDGKEVDVLVIEDRPLKPYFTTSKIGRVLANHIYSRVMDVNTPCDRNVAPFHVEHMWRERFGLTLPAKRRVNQLLSNWSDWEYEASGGTIAAWFHTVFPEFSIRVEEAEKHLDCRQEWTRGEIRSDNNFSYYYTIFYRQTILARIHCVSFDDKKKSMVAPSWEPARRGDCIFMNGTASSTKCKGFMLLQKVVLIAQNL